MARNKKTCFVIIGFGPKPDLEIAGRFVDLDKTFENLIKPVFDELNIDCFRAKEIRHVGNIDVPMYEWIYKADIVIADISTLNPNALYELGVRHALRPNTTIVISESQTKYPFDLNHTLITRYEHLGKDIGVSEAKRFKDELKKTVEAVLKNKANDSPVYTYLPKLLPPKFDEVNLSKLRKKKSIEPSLSELIDDAEKCKDNEQFLIAVELYRECLKFEPENVFLKQRVVLCTYKSKKPNPKKALLDAQKLISELNPDETTDTETLGLAGSIQKRLFEETNHTLHLDVGIKYYSKGFYVSRDYYNGINYAYLLTVKSAIVQDVYEGISFFVQANQIRSEIVNICNEIIKQASFRKRGDKHWIYQTLAQCHLALNNKIELDAILQKAMKLSIGKFDRGTFIEQNKLLISYISQARRKHKI